MILRFPGYLHSIEGLATCTYTQNVLEWSSLRHPMKSLNTKYSKNVGDTV